MHGSRGLGGNIAAELTTPYGENITLLNQAQNEDAARAADVIP